MTKSWLKFIDDNLILMSVLPIFVMTCCTYSDSWAAPALAGRPWAGLGAAVLSMLPQQMDTFRVRLQFPDLRALTVSW